MFIKGLKAYLYRRYFLHGFYIVCAIRKGKERSYLRLYTETSDKKMYPCPSLEEKVKNEFYKITKAKADTVVILSITKVPTRLFMSDQPEFVTTLIEGALMMMSTENKKPSPKKSSSKK